MPEEKKGHIYFLTGGETDSLRENLTMILDKLMADSRQGTCILFVVFSWSLKYKVLVCH